MDAERTREREERCTAEQPPACVAACPLRVDARALAEAVGRGDLAAGWAVLARQVPLPRLVAWTCEAPCEPRCRRGEAGDPVRIGALERACAVHGGAAPARRRLPLRNRRVAVVGGGVSGVVAAIELGYRGHAVTLYERGAALLGRIRTRGDAFIPATALDADLAALSAARVEVHLEVEIGAGEGPLGLPALADGFDALYLGPGPGSPLAGCLGLARTADGRIEVADVTFATSHPKIFAGGTHRTTASPYSPTRSLQDGLHAALSIDRLLQGASLTARRERQGPIETRLHVETRDLALSAAVRPSDAVGGYGPEEAAREAARCLPCRCLECVKVCEFLAHHRSTPRRYVREIYNNDCIVMGAHQANRMVNSCTLCGLCEAVCPEKLSMADACLEARRSMVAKGKMPPSAHEFALRDMEFSVGPAFALARHAPGHDRSEALFFPGCQLAGSSPDHVVRAYARLREELGGPVGLVLGCCGAPARWAGREERFREVLWSLTGTWAAMGRPRLVTACGSCYRTVKDELPELPVESLWTVLRTPPPAAPRGGRLAVHDPCTVRDDVEIHAGVRRLLAGVGVEALELNAPGLGTCCGYGGLAQFGSPEVAAKIVRRRAAESPADFVTSCAMCRDNFARHGKRAVHLLDLLFPEGEGDPAARPDPGFSRRQEDRARLRARLLREVWHEPVEEERAAVELELSPAVRELLERRMILEEDLRRTIARAEAGGARLRDPRTGRLLASHRPAAVTYWVEYEVAGGGYVVHNAYSHRMEVAG